eukprot:TRINITY_DN10332_c0_g1_i1.p1 TRINITY_DN10332_c0_g1~~TRINITY_DN10332_c0_g1_i1.p1  ORF type:complete len:227 (-),score=38.19 TRINITY_DN10332_c0_g1_i1:16-696(-)
MKCKDCFSTFSSKQSYFQHIRDNHGREEEYQSYRNRAKLLKLKLRKQRQIAKGLIPCPKEDCGRHAKTKIALRQHLFDAHNYEELSDSNEADSGDYSDLNNTDIMVLDYDTIKMQASDLSDRLNTCDMLASVPDSHTIGYETIKTIEILLRIITESVGVGADYSTLGKMVKKLKGIIPEDLYTRTKQMKHVRNILSHEPDVYLGPHITKRYVNLLNGYIAWFNERQ